KAALIRLLRGVQLLLALFSRTQKTPGQGIVAVALQRLSIGLSGFMKSLLVEQRAAQVDPMYAVRSIQHCRPPAVSFGLGGPCLQSNGDSQVSPKEWLSGTQIDRLLKGWLGVLRLGFGPAGWTPGKH